MTITKVSSNAEDCKNMTFRIFDGEAVGIMPDTSGYAWANKIYIGNDRISSTGASFMIPKSSPLKVCFYNSFCLWQSYLHLCITERF